MKNQCRTACKADDNPFYRISSPLTARLLTAAVALAAAMTLSSCNEMLDKEPLDSFTDDNFWTAERNVEGYANMFYNSFDGYSRSLNANAVYYWHKLNDDMVCANFADWYVKVTPATSDEWKNGFREVRRANVMIEHLPGMTALTATERDHWTGVARMMRAWNYYLLVRMFGDVPLVTASVDIDDDGVLYAPRTARDVVMDSVLADLTYASLHMRDLSAHDQFSRAMAHAMRSEVCLYEGTQSKYRPAPDMAHSTRFLQAAKESAQTLMGDAAFSLCTTYQEKYCSEDLSKNPEIIFYKPYSQGVMYHPLIIYLCASTTIDGMSRDAFDSYLFTDGLPRKLTSLDTTVVAVARNGNYNISAALALRDKRLAATVDSCIFFKGKTFKRYNRGIAMTSSSGYGIQKFDSPDIDDANRYNNSSSANFTHAPIFTLAREYLVYAEACAEMGTLTQDDLDASINLLRQRAGLPAMTLPVAFSDPANNMGVSDLIWEVRRERRVELMYDGDRYWDLVRWHQLNLLDTSRYPAQNQGADVTAVAAADRADVQVTTVARTGTTPLLYIGDQRNSRTFDDRYYLFPVPSGQIILNDKLTQNPGW